MKIEKEDFEFLAKVILEMRYEDNSTSRNDIEKVVQKYLPNFWLDEDTYYEYVNMEDEDD